MKNPRYILSLDTNFFFLPSGEKRYLTSMERGPFVDILSPMECEGICERVNIKVFLRGGEIILGYVSGQCIKLNDRDCLFDGRFNSDKVVN